MKNFLPIAIIVAILFAGCSGNKNELRFPEKWEIVSNRDSKNSIAPFVVLELYTSEGCYDCPAAEVALNNIANDARANKQNIITVAKHVDYWNDLMWGEGDCRGTWEDSFSKGRFTAHQFSNAERLQTTPVTPQVFINGKTFINDPPKEEMQAIINEVIKEIPVFGINLELNNDQSDFNKRRIVVDFNLEKQKNIDVKFRKTITPQLHLVMTERNVISRIDSAENCGKTLHYQCVAREFVSRTVRSSLEGTMILEYPEDVKLENASIVAYVQNLKNQEIIGGTVGFDFKKKQDSNTK